ncbi:hypothetical protein F1654_08905 [Alkalicaulis satelles]|uniref:Uncharacterized protein n=1 Tax=Alkalicaulis satelles TaxID=2609175 RepID=A0A5M6ZJI3_9PROT|nr:hypothetical protein [Alkalicaulis satelles]KAA5803904.1 hypothetical protein F1654_08905 [Alkalicaulis satelles]
MAVSRKDEARLFSKDELELVERSHHPALADIDDKTLAETRKLVRERRQRALDISKRQRREMRGKAKAQGAKPAADNLGSKEKAAALSNALKRLNAEHARRSEASAREATRSGMKKALEMKRAASAAKRPASRTASEGMKKKTSAKREQITDPREVGRVSQKIKKAQAKRDG